MTDFIIILLSIPPLLISIWYFFKGYLNTVVVIYPVFFLFYVTPSFLNVIYGVPIYSGKFDNFRLSNEDSLTSLIYGGFILSLILFFTYRLLKSKKTKLIIKQEETSPFIDFMLLLFSFGGIILVLFSPNPEIYFNYGEIRSRFDTIDYLYYVYVSFVCVISAFCVLLLRFRYGKNITNIKSFFLIVILLLDILFNGKRLLMFFLPVYFMIGYLFSDTKRIEIIKVIASVLMFTLCYSYYTNEIKFDSTNLKSAEERYEGMRIDFGRDDVLKFAIYETLILDESIVDYPGQTILGSFLAYVPRSFFPNEQMKPYPYAQYLTNKLVYNKQGAGLRGWTVTTSFIDEFLSNFGWFGFLFVFLFYQKSFTYIDKIDSQIQRFYFYIVLAFLHVIHPHGIMPLVYFALFLMIKRYVVICKIRR